MDFTKVLIIDFGSQYTQNVAKKVREAGVYSVILPCTATAEKIKEANASAIILSGGMESVFDAESIKLSPAVLETNVPVLGIGFGMQALALAIGARLEQNPSLSYLVEELNTLVSSPLLANVPAKANFALGFADLVLELPEGAKALASTKRLPIAAFGLEERKLYGVQFHPEADETGAGIVVLENFLFEIAKLSKNWNMRAFIDRTVAECKSMIGDSQVVLGLSGGVDSTVVAALLHKAIGSQLHCIFVDSGLMRHNEGHQVISTFEEHMPGVNIYNIQAQDYFLSKLAGVDNPEEKRKIIGAAFIDVFEREAKKIPNVHFLGQGTIYPDIVESYTAKGAVIKSHHNVGGLPEKMHLSLVEPLKELFKDEVRAVGEELGLPHEAVWRHPFPGPGLAVRVLGAVSKERLDVLRAADLVVQEELRASGWYHKVWQGFAILLPLNTVGMRNDTRTYENVVALRVVDSVDAMSATWSKLPYEVLEQISQRILREVDGVNRVVLDISSKPPSTIEWE